MSRVTFNCMKPAFLELLVPKTATQLLEYRPGWRGKLHRFLAWVLDHTGAALYIQTTEFHTVNLESREFCAALLEAAGAIGDVLGRDPQMVIVGTKTLNEWMRNVRQPDGIEFDFMMEYGRQRTIYSIPVKVVPWIEGWAVI